MPMDTQNLWKAVFSHREEEEDSIEFFFIASVEYEDAFEVLKQITKEYDYEEYSLDSLSYAGVIYVQSDDNKATTEENI